MICIDSEHGRIGELWWINSDPGRPTQTGFLGGIRLRAVRWGTCGIGRDIRVALEAI